MWSWMILGKPLANRAHGLSVSVYFEDPTSIYLDNEIVGDGNFNHELPAIVWGMGDEME